jgi:hypothetical protein
VQHSYVIPAYGRSPHLEACLASLRVQAGSDVVVSTSTPFEGLESLAKAHGARLSVHGPNAGIGHDWNMALRATVAPLVTIAHQDDTYSPGHAAAVVSAFGRRPGALLAFTDYRELADGQVRPRNRTMLVKSLQRELAFLGRKSVGSIAGKRLLLRFGNPIPCPAVTFNRSRVPHFAFRTDMRTNMDWAAWIDLAGEPGEFLYLRESLVRHRIHPGSETTACIADGARAREDEDMFLALWPRPIARVLARMYAASYGTNG